MVRSDDIAELIEKLGSDEHTVRSESHEKLLSIGGPAIPFLRKAVSHLGPFTPDSEIRLRSTRLLILIERKEYEKKTREFLDGERDDIDLTGWKEFAIAVGDAGDPKVTRQLFIAMHEAQPELMNALDEGRQKLREQHQNVVRRRMYTSNYSNANRVLGTVASVLFTAAKEFSSESDGDSSRISISDYNMTRLRSELTQPQMITFIESTSHKQQIIRLVRNWLKDFHDSEASLLMIKLEFIKAMKIKEELPLVVSTTTNPRTHKSARIFALRIIEAIGDGSLTDELEHAFGDKEVLGKYLVRAPNSKKLNDSTDFEPIEVRFCDLALAVAAQLKELPPAQLGFHKTAYSEGKFVANRAGFRTAEDRKAAFETWEALNK